ncbi:Scramblase [Exidia glandulosa HHB12029]|uniref:Phospholipid scramblase n=1 Tax=Exidia glandulosa HHB12029 TaxID=1314781 RepID=A0A165D9S9_EXIGL|nr:Scramblase [Exidia glandulosa HHB12029]
MPVQQEPADSPMWDGTILLPRRDARESLERMLSNDMLVVTRQLEMLNIFMGFEQSNKYAINNVNGEVVGYIVEEPRGFLQTLSRQLFRTHRPFRALVLDRDGSPLLWMRRPFSWINSKMYVQHQAFSAEPDTLREEQEPTLETFGVIQQRWHLWRRRYQLFLRDSSLKEDTTQEKQDDEVYAQFGDVDAGFLSWEFPVVDEVQEIALVERNFRGFGREIFTDSGQYAIRFVPDLENERNADLTYVRKLDVNERALVLALSINTDFDFFSRHSEGGGSWFLPLLIIFGE